MNEKNIKIAINSNYNFISNLYEINIKNYILNKK